MINKAAMSVSKTVSVSLIIFQVLLFGFGGKKIPVIYAARSEFVFSSSMFSLNRFLRKLSPKKPPRKLMEPSD